LPLRFNGKDNYLKTMKNDPSIDDDDEEELEISPDYPLGGSCEPHDIEEEKELLN
jgi:hypothetical protein